MHGPRASRGERSSPSGASGGRHPRRPATPLIRRTPVARAEIAFYGPRSAAAMLHPGAGRWPAHETSDRLALGIGMVALAAQGSPDVRWEGLRSILTPLATRIAEGGEGPLPGDLAPLEALGVPGCLAVVRWEGPGLARLEADLLSTRGGLVPVLAEHPAEAGPVKELAALALLIALAADADPGRLALALGIEGVLAWYRQSDRLSPPRNALGYALAHVRERLSASGMPVPAGL